MQLRDAYPVDTVGGSCFVTGRYELDEDEKVIDLDINLDAKPAWGRVCVSAEAVRQMGVCLGWDMSPRKDKQLQLLRQAHGVLQAENEQLRQALRSVIDAAQVARIVVADEEAAAEAEASAEAERLADELDAEHAARVEAEEQAAEATEELEHEKRSKAALKGHLKRAKNEGGDSE